MTYTWTIPLKTVSEANSSEHWSVKAKRHKQQQLFIRLAYEKYVTSLVLPCQVTLTRLAPRLLDDDNLRSALKYIRDEISECMLPEKTGTYITKKGIVKKIKGRADSDHRISWDYHQIKHTIQCVKVCIVTPNNMQGFCEENC